MNGSNAHRTRRGTSRGSPDRPPVPGTDRAGGQRRERREGLRVGMEPGPRGTWRLGLQLSF